MLAISMLIAWCGVLRVLLPQQGGEQPPRAETRALAVVDHPGQMMAPAVEFEERKSAEAEIANVNYQPGLLYVVVLTHYGNPSSAHRPRRSTLCRAGGLVTQDSGRAGPTLHVSIPVGARREACWGTMVAGFSAEHPASRQESMRTALSVAPGSSGGAGGRHGC